MNRDGSNGAHSHNKKESENTVKESHGCPELVNFCCGTEVGVGGDSFRIIAARSRPAGTSKRRSGVRIHPTTSEIFGVDKSGRRDDETTAIRRRRSFKDNCRRFLLFYSTQLPTRWKTHSRAHQSSKQTHDRNQSIRCRARLRQLNLEEKVFLCIDKMGYLICSQRFSANLLGPA